MITLASFNWGTGPKIPVTFAYERQRSGADMQYRVQVTIDTIGSSSYFGYPIYLKLTMDGTLRDNPTLKVATPNQWSSAITYTSPWYTVSNKTSGTTLVSFNLYSGSGSTRNDTYSYSMAVDPAASRLTAPNGTLGTALDLTVTKYNDNFTHTIRYSCGTASGEILTTAPNTSVKWETSNGNTFDLAAQNTAGQSVTVAFTIITYSGTTEIGRNTTSCTMAIPSDKVKPSVSIAVADAAGYLATYGAYVQGKSKLTITATPTLAYGSPIKTYEITADGKTYTSSPVTTDVLHNTGTLAVTAKVTDNRTYPSNVASTNITVLEYAPPGVTVTAYRCNSSGTADQEGAYMKFGFSATISSLNSKNSATYSISYKAGSGTATKVTGNGLSYTSAVIACDVSKIWTIEVTVTDKLSSTTKAAVIPIAFTLMDFYSTGKGIAFGKVGTREGFDCAMNAYFTGATAVSGAMTSSGGATFSGALTATGTTAMPSGMTIGGKTLLNLIYPVGSIYMSVSSTSPATFLGGTWERIQDKFLLSAGSTYGAGATGGSATNDHCHFQTVGSDGSASYFTKAGVSPTTRVVTVPGTHIVTSGNYSDSKTLREDSTYMATISTMPPYLAVYVWKRTA